VQHIVVTRYSIILLNAFLQVDLVSKQLLMNSSTNAMSSHYSPKSIVGDGNFFYRAVSLALYGTQDMHDYLRLKTGIQILEHRELYDERSETFVLKGKPVLTPSFHEVLQNVLRIGRYAELVHLFALSAAMGLTISSYCCSTSYMGQELHPLTMTIKGNTCEHELPETAASHPVLMWTSTRTSLKEPNHFVLLVPCRSSIDVTDKLNLTTSSFSPPTHESTRISAKINSIANPCSPILESAQQADNTALSQPVEKTLMSQSITINDSGKSTQPLDNSPLSVRRGRPRSSSATLSSPDNTRPVTKRARPSHRSPSSQSVISGKSKQRLANSPLSVRRGRPRRRSATLSSPESLPAIVQLDQSRRNSHLSFEIESSIANYVPVEEDSIDDLIPEISAASVSSEEDDFHIDVGGSKRGKNLLIEKPGFGYNVMRR